jgi:multidrug efflux pump subunit AcrB
MAVNISAWSIRRPLPSVVPSLILLILGWTSFMRLPIARFPPPAFPSVQWS